MDAVNDLKLKEDELTSVHRQESIKFLIPPPHGGWKFIKSVGEEYQVVKSQEGKEIAWLWGRI